MMRARCDFMGRHYLLVVAVRIDFFQRRSCKNQEPAAEAIVNPLPKHQFLYEPHSLAVLGAHIYLYSPSDSLHMNEKCNLARFILNDYFKGSELLIKSTYT